MLTLETINSRPNTCQKCKGLFKVACSKDSAVKERLIELNITSQRIQFVKVLRQATNCDLKDAKGTYLHYVHEAGKCHRCNSKIEVTEFIDCPKCKSLNIYPLASNY